MACIVVALDGLGVYLDALCCGERIIGGSGERRAVGIAVARAVRRSCSW
ncbi:MAG: hypothetical protein ACRDND_16670 [Streptosporangiaceae bacterium]